MKKPTSRSEIPANGDDTTVITATVERQIRLIRGEKVLLDSDLAALYGVTTKRFNEQLRRNRDRFPPDFMFQLSTEEAAALRSQNATLKTGRGQHRKYLPYAFTEHGAIMAATILNSPRAIGISVHVVRAFVQLRLVIASNQAIARKVRELERTLVTHDEAISNLIRAIQQMTSPPAPKRRGIGFVLDEE